MKDIALLLIGSSISLASSFLAIRWQAKRSLKVRMDEIVAEKKVAINSDAYKHLKKIGSILEDYRNINIRGALGYMLDLEEWWLSNRIYMTKGLPENWLKTRNLLRIASTDGGQAAELQTTIRKSIDDAIQAIYDEMGLEKIEIK